MSATPRPWKITDEWAPGWRIAATIGTDEHDVAQVRPMENAHLIVRAVNAFDALLAVAKAADDGLGITTKMTLDELDAAHPGWREWAP